MSPPLRGANLFYPPSLTRFWFVFRFRRWAVYRRLEWAEIRLADRWGPVRKPGLCGTVALNLLRKLMHLCGLVDVW